MSGAHPRARLVARSCSCSCFGAFLAIIGITATAQSVMVVAHFSTATLNDVVGSDAATTRAFVNAHAPADGPRPATAPSADRAATLEAQLATLTSRARSLRVEIRRPDGTDRRRRATRRRRAAPRSPTPAFAAAAEGHRPGGDRPGRRGGRRARRPRYSRPA